MDISVIPWNVFLDALNKEQPGTSNFGAALVIYQGVIVADQRVLKSS